MENRNTFYPAGEVQSRRAFSADALVKTMDYLYMQSIHMVFSRKLPVHMVSTSTEKMQQKVYSREVCCRLYSK